MKRSCPGSFLVFWEIKVRYTKVTLRRQNENFVGKEKVWRLLISSGLLILHVIDYPNVRIKEAVVMHGLCSQRR